MIENRASTEVDSRPRDVSASPGGKAVAVVLEIVPPAPPPSHAPPFRGVLDQETELGEVFSHDGLPSCRRSAHVAWRYEQPGR